MSIHYFRAAVATGLKSSEVSPVDRKAKVIHGYAVNTLGEAQGHGLWLDSDFLDSVVKCGNESKNGLKTRFGHPGMCSDGLGTLLGHTTNLYRDGDVVRGDLHLCDAAEISPNGNLSDYVMSLAEKNPNQFGASIVFARNRGLEKEFNGKFSDKEGVFKSPDKGNAKNLPHARLDSLRASDVVDDPAANPGGFFSSNEEAASLGERTLEYLFGLSNDAPESAFGSFEPERVKTFVQSFLQRHPALQSIKKEALMPTETPAPKVGATLKELRSAFPKHIEFAADQFESGATLDEAKNAFKDVQLAEKDAEIAALKAKPTVVPAPAPAPKPSTAPAPAKFSEDAAENATDKGFMQLSREYASAHKCTLSIAMEKTALHFPDVHAAFVSECRSAKPRKIERPKIMDA